jgi:hypothetical protein
LKHEYVFKDGIQMIKFTSDKWVQFDSSPNPLNFNILNMQIRQVDCEIYLERFSGIVTEIFLSVSFDAQAGLVMNLPFLNYQYS